MSKSYKAAQFNGGLRPGAPKTPYHIDNFEKNTYDTVIYPNTIDTQSVETVTYFPKKKKQSAI